MSSAAFFTSKSSKSRWGKQTPVVIAILGFIAVFQVCYQGFLLSTIHQREELDHLDDACGIDVESSQCLEQRIYMGWQEESALEEHHKAHVDRVVDAVFQAVAVGSHATLWEEHKSNIHAQIDAQHKALPAEEREKAQEIHAVHGDKLLDATLEAVHGKQSGETVDDIKQRMLDYQLEREHQRQERAEKYRKEHEERMLQFDKLYNETMASMHSPPTPSPWVENLKTLQKHFEELSKKNNERKHRHQEVHKKQEGKRLTLAQWRDHTASSSFLAAQTIQWQPVTQWKTVIDNSDAGLVIASWEDLHARKWSGKKPHVACITMVPGGTHSVHHMMYFINNWKLQDWESKELVLVYQHSDKRLAKVVQKYVDGKSIKAVAARDGKFPSTAAMRFGAWSVKTDIIARWDFDEWHHPEQLTLQVNAMAFTSRPASLLQPKGTHGGNATDREATLLGEAKWMREEWYPFLNHGSDVLEENKAHHIVQVDVEQLDINAKSADNVSSEEALEMEHVETDAGVAICMKLQKQEHQQLTVSRGELPVAAP
mmetsp:Transcript_90864/g.143544  ORF Transcript_90864/g.143544 Transcript_90864/m.143544 type:complete len:541 (-) Transcript_90864:3-1625(-)